METQRKTLLNKLVALPLAAIFALSLFLAPAAAYAAEGDGVQEADQTQTGAATQLPIMLGMTQLQPNATELELLRINSDFNGTLYITITAVDQNGTETPLLRNKAWDASQVQAAQATGDDPIAKVMTMGVPGGQTVGEFFAAHAYLKLQVASQAVGGETQAATVYPVYARPVDGSDVFIGTRSDLGSARVDKIGASDVLYTFDENDAAIAHSLIKDCEVADHSYIVTYGEGTAVEGAVQGIINYIDGKGEIVKSTPAPNLGAESKTFTIDTSFVINSKYYRVVNNLAGDKISMTAQTPTYTLVVSEIADANNLSYVATIRYMQEDGKDANGNVTGSTFLWSDTFVAKTSDNAYSYALPLSFSMANPFESVDQPYELYTLDQTHGLLSGTSGVTLSKGALEFKGSDIKGIEPNNEGVREVTIEVGYEPTRLSNKAMVTIREIDARTGELIPYPEDSELSAVRSFEVTPYSETLVYTPESTIEIEGADTYEVWSGSSDPITVSWDNLFDVDAISDGKGGFVRNVYYVPEGYELEPYDLTVRYVNILTPDQPLMTRSITVYPDDNTYTRIDSEAAFSLNGNDYVRLAGQDEPIWHAYPSGNEDTVYTIYYRDVNDTLNANTVIRRTQIIDTYREIIIPGTTTTLAAPAVVGADGVVGTGVLPGDGTVIVNDDTNPLAGLDGTDTATERTIEDEENPLASADGFGALNWGAVAGICLGIVALAVLCALFFFMKRRKKESDSTTQANA